MRWDPEWVVLSMLAGGVLTMSMAILVLVVWVVAGGLDCPR